MSQTNLTSWLESRGVLGEQTIKTDRQCLSCGYNLRGLKIGGRCPECATVIPRKILSYHLMDASADYLRSLRLGMRLVAVGVLGPVVFSLVMKATSFNLGGLWFSSAVAILFQAMLVFGGWIVTQPRPTESGRLRRWWAYPNIVRASLILALVAQGLAFTGGVASASRLVAAAPVFAVGWIIVAAAVFGVILAYMNHLLLCWIFRDLAAWAMDDQMARGFEIIIFLLVTPLLIVGVSLLFVQSAAGCFVCALTPMLFVGEVWFLVNVLRLAALINAAARYKNRSDS